MHKLLPQEAVEESTTKQYLAKKFRLLRCQQYIKLYHLFMTYLRNRIDTKSQYPYLRMMYDSLELKHILQLGDALRYR